MSSKFNTIALDQLLNDAIQSTEEVHNQLIKSEDDELISQSAVSPQIDKLINQKNGQSVDYSRVYAQLEKLIENGNVALQVLGAIDPDVSGSDVAGSTASLLNAIKNCIAEFTKIHLQHIKFQQVLKLEQIKHKHKLEQLQIKKQIAEAKNKNNSNSNIIDVSTVDQKDFDNTKLIPWETQGITKYLEFLKNKK